MKIIQSGVIEADGLKINQRQLELRLHLPAGTLSKENEYEYSDVLIRCERTLKKECCIRYAFLKVEADIEGDRSCNLELFSIDSVDLAKNLKGSTGAVLMGVTLGAEADRLLKRLSITSKSEHFITDALASALVDTAADRVEELARNNLNEVKSCSFRQRYSPGYGDCSIENQRAFLKAIEGEKNLGISLNDHCFMSPSKSITSIMGFSE